MEQAAADAGVTLPIEQTDVWARFQADIPWPHSLGRVPDPARRRDRRVHRVHRHGDARIPLPAFDARPGLDRQAGRGAGTRGHRRDRRRSAPSGQARGVHPYRHVVHRRHRAGAVDRAIRPDRGDRRDRRRRCDPESHEASRPPRRAQVAARMPGRHRRRDEAGDRRLRGILRRDGGDRQARRIHARSDHRLLRHDRGAGRGSIAACSRPASRAAWWHGQS